jgi:hypothetical protein
LARGQQRGGDEVLLVVLGVDLVAKGLPLLGG